MSLTYSPKDNLWSISEIVDGRESTTESIVREGIFATYERDVLVYFVASILSGGNLPSYFTTTSTFMAIKLLCEPLVYSHVPLSLLFSFAFKTGK